VGDGVVHFMTLKMGALLAITAAIGAAPQAWADLSPEQQSGLSTVIQSAVITTKVESLQSVVGTMATAAPAEAANITTFATTTLMADMPTDGSAKTMDMAKSLISAVVKSVVQAVPSSAPSVAAAVANAVTGATTANASAMAQAMTVSAITTVVATAPGQTAAIMAQMSSAASGSAMASAVQQVQASLAPTSSDTVVAAAAPTPSATTTNNASNNNSANATLSSTTPISATAEIHRNNTASPSS
jgi:hypothetical protein